MFIIPRFSVVGDAHPLASPPDGSQFILKQIEVPAPTASEQTKTSGKPAEIDWAVVNPYKRKLGDQGARFIRDLEKLRLTDAGRADLGSNS